MTAFARLRHAAHREAETYRHGEDRPLGPYAAALGTYGGAVGALVAVAALTGRRPPERVGPWDLAILSLATHKLSRLLTKDAVTAPLRAPFTLYRGPAGQGEVAEDVRTDSAPRHGIGELLTCPFCLAQWIATGFVAGLVFAPRATRLVAATFASVATSDMLQDVYAALRRAAGE